MLQAGKRPTIFGDGETSRDFTFVLNNVNANLLACKAPGVAGQVFNIACGTSFSLNTLVSELNSILGTSIEPEHLPERNGDIKHSKADIQKARTLLGYEPLIGFREGLERLVSTFEQ
jgi:UDP-glucose 4-epimerase